MLLPFGEYRPDVSDYEGQHTKNLANVLPRGDGYGPMPDVAALTSALAAACRGLFVALKNDGTVVIFGATSTRLYKLSNTDYTWTDWSKGGLAYTPLNATENWEFAQFGNNVVAVQANTAPQVFDITSGATAFADLGGSPPQARYIAVINRFLVLTGLNSAPYRVQWSGLNAITTWTSGTTLSDSQDFPDGGFVRRIVGGEFGIISQDTMFRRMTFIPGATSVAGTTFVFQFEKIAQNDGVYAPYSVVKVGDVAYYISPQGFKSISGSGMPQPIGKERIDRTFFANVDSSNLQLCMGVADPKSRRVFWTYKSTATSGTTFDSGLVYDIDLDRWAPLTWTGEFLATLMQPGTTLEGVDAAYGSNIDTLTLSSFDIIANASLPQMAMVNSTHKVALFTGSNLEATLETSEHGAAPQRIRVRGFRPITDATGYYGKLSYRDLQSATASTTTEIAVSSGGRIDVNKSCRYARGRIRIPAGITWTFAVGVEPDVMPEGLR